MSELVIRLAMAADAAAMAEIYNQGIAERIATFETALRNAAQVAEQLAEKGERFPTLVVESAGRVVAFAAAGAYRSRPCYAGIAEHSVYVAAAARGLGAGRAALGALIETYEARGFWKLLSRIFVENDASRNLCRKTGFREVGVYEKHGRLDGVWRDVVIVEKLIPVNFK